MEPNQNSSGMINGLPPIPQETRRIGPIIGVTVIVLAVVSGALYFFSQKLNTSPTNTNADSMMMKDSTNKTPMNSNSSSTDTTADIKADLDTQLKDVDYSF